jgi:hypothetical protein
MANFMARYRRGDGHYADLECVDAALERYLVLKLQRIRKKKATSLVALVGTGRNNHVLCYRGAAHNPTTGSRPASLIDVKMFKGGSFRVSVVILRG